MLCGREVLYEAGPDGKPRVTGLRVGSQAHEFVVKADAYVAALDVPGAKKLIPQVRGRPHALPRRTCPALSRRAACPAAAGELLQWFRFGALFAAGRSCGAGVCVGGGPTRAGVAAVPPV